MCFAPPPCSEVHFGSTALAEVSAVILGKWVAIVKVFVLLLALAPQTFVLILHFGISDEV